VADETGEVRTQKLDPEAEARRRVALAQIRQYPDPVLRMRAREVEEFDGDLEKLAERLTHLLREANGLGLAATQIGVLRSSTRPSRRPRTSARATPRAASRSRAW
jgi:peptide deformylase